MIGDQAQLTPGYVARHLPPTSRLGAGFARLDIAQDFLLAHLAEQGVFDLVTFKGGTALRKLFAGGQGRFSTDIDLASHPDAEADRHALTELVASHCDTTLGPFQYVARPQRDRYTVQVTTALGSIEQTIKLEIGPPCWLPPEPRAFIPHVTHQRYGFPLPALPCMSLEEILAEKVARLTRQSTARDAYDLVWAARTSPWSQFDRTLVRRLAMLKVWADNHGLGTVWRPALHPQAFDAARWLGPRGNVWDDEQIGLLARPAPSLADLGADLVRYYGWLGDLDEDEAVWANADPRDRAIVLAALQGLPGKRLAGLPLY
jgi:predicted nucleotidyltransferase component of viral defense system